MLTVSRFATTEHEDKKLCFYGNLIANIAFTTQFDRAYANLLVRLGQGLSYRQLCLLAILARMEISGGSSLRKRDDRNDVATLGPSTVAILFELYYLYGQGLVNSGNVAVLSAAEIVPANFRIQGPGAALFKLMELKWIWAEPGDLNPVISLLS